MQAAVAEPIEFEMPAAPPPARASSKAVAKRPAATARVPAAAKPAVAQAGPSLMDLLSVAVTSGNVDLVREMRAIQKDWEADEARKAWNEAFAAAKAQIEPVMKNRRVGYEAKNVGSKDVSYMHEDLAGIADAIDKILAEEGMFYYWKTENDFKAGMVTVTCFVCHRMGHREETALTAGVDVGSGKNHLQAISSATTYLERGTLKAGLGLSSKHDDDGRAAGGPTDGSEFAAASDKATITEAQADEITTLLKDTGGDLKKFREWAGVENVSDIPAARHKDCIIMINSAAAARKKEK